MATSVTRSFGDILRNSLRINSLNFRQICTTLPNLVYQYGSGHLWSTEFWDRFYENKLDLKETSFDWFLSYESLKCYILPILQDVCISENLPIKVLDIGSGTSEFAVKLYESSAPPIHQITCIDFSEVAVKQMKSFYRLLEPRDSTSPGVSYVIGDVSKLYFDNDTFDMILDKGTTDAVIRNPRGKEIFGEMFKECLRVLKNGRTWVQVSDTPPEDRLDLLEKFKLCQLNEDSLLHVSYKDLGISFGVEYFMYFISKSSG